ncbi:hypothetical protein RM863_35250 [Streptomyces sp. DSM 41014]|uniref:Uncharacterized protein n=1 Tax=Streptomyces hintoniae TaxID=3075521 RepID=A0ABU2UVS0_9ACTN|nr:hypothetical protein [Streptomyces sp. DSM 41014]MDT0477392.1 hypothetical protein [Streptomyces sp. DSM 41014]
MSQAQAEQLTARRQQELESIARTVQREMLFWLARLDPEDLLGSWFSEVLPGLYAALTRGQVRAAGGASAFVAEAATLMGLDAATDWSVVPDAFGRSAADGRPVSTLLTTPALRGHLAVAERGQGAEWAAGQVRQSVLLMGASEVADAGRGAVQTAMAGTPRITGYIRCIQAGACRRCAILAGRWYRWSADFLRHPRCHCYQIPAGESHRGRGGRGSWRTDPRAYFDRLTSRDQDRVFGRGGAAAIRAGADLPSVVNARRTAASLRRLDVGGGTIVTTTVEGTTKRGYYSHVRRQLERIEGRELSRLRLTPEAIFRLAADRTELVRLLGRHGYLVRAAADIARL